MFFKTLRLYFFRTETGIWHSELYGSVMKLLSGILHELLSILLSYLISLILQFSPLKALIIYRLNFAYPFSRFFCRFLNIFQFKPKFCYIFFWNNDYFFCRGMAFSWKLEHILAKNSPTPCISSAIWTGLVSLSSPRNIHSKLYWVRREDVTK